MWEWVYFGCAYGSGCSFGCACESGCSFECACGSGCILGVGEFWVCV